MIAALFGITYAMILQQGDVYRQHIQETPIVLYTGQDASANPSSWLYSNRQSRFVVGGVQWTATNQYEESSDKVACPFGTFNECAYV
jgi:hypothetical protein